jgi:hypothetical protein
VHDSPQGNSPAQREELTVQTTEQGATSSRLYAYTVREFDGADGKKARAWTRIGVAFPHKDGTGFNVEVHSFPLDGRIVLFPADADAREEEPADAAPPPPAPNRNGNQRRR